MAADVDGKIRELLLTKPTKEKDETAEPVA
jgi:hypothetical protein